MNAIDYDDVVILMGYEPRAIKPTKTIPTVLSEAVRLVVEHWSGNLEPAIYRAAGGLPIRDMASIQQIYDRPDFPAGAQASRLTA
jgi:hypothetical protein